MMTDCGAATKAEEAGVPRMLAVLKVQILAHSGEQEEIGISSPESRDFIIDNV